jgi:hypothetical protein
MGNVYLVLTFWICWEPVMGRLKHKKCTPGPTLQHR